eukprot:CAMPEP_0194749566 /NCGR_PEP_ID=MMETSP0323_2-20130528/3720_1 /TAXON_ID=2866 ORGANISM="Crypthecodinium cohnii, Strain Seligo" /NCGR_SAMPLE_ID=MMETSP0323_2 /ASSEMBLY_ACC=CAM_ASM_000346 /LENGTH=39 /DNA_ID= /DNA_START= /DNA_END= /DNA_ORIENTATION=
MAKQSTSAPTSSTVEGSNSVCQALALDPEGFFSLSQDLL